MYGPADLTTEELRRRRNVYRTILARETPAANHDDVAWWEHLVNQELIKRAIPQRCETCNGTGEMPADGGHLWTRGPVCPACEGRKVQA
jgi:hypothetical protein